MTWSTFRLWGASLCEAVPSCGFSGFSVLGTVIKCGCCGLRWVTPPSNCEVSEVWSSQARRFAAVTAPPARGVCFHAHFFYGGIPRLGRREIGVVGARAIGAVGVILFGVVIKFMTHLVFFWRLPTPPTASSLILLSVSKIGCQSFGELSALFSRLSC